MLIALRILPTVIACLMLGAHFLRGGSLILTAAWVLFPLFLVARRPWARLLVQLGLAGGAALWLGVAAQNIVQRQSAGAPWIRLALILAAVATFTLFSAWLLQGGRMRSFFRVESGGAKESPTAQRASSSRSPGRPPP